MLATVRTGARTTVVPHLRWVAGRRVNLNPPPSCLPRCNFRQLSSSPVSRSPPELASGTAGAPCVIHSSRFPSKAWLKVTNNAQATADRRTPEKHSPSKQTTDTTRHRSVGLVPTVSQIRVQLSPRTGGLILFSARHIQERHPALKIFAEDKPDLPSGVSVWSPGVSCRFHRTTAR